MWEFSCGDSTWNFFNQRHVITFCSFLMATWTWSNSPTSVKILRLLFSSAVMYSRSWRWNRFVLSVAPRYDRSECDLPKTCRFFRKVSQYRHLWLTLATNLDYDHAPNLAPHESLQSLSTERIREMVIRSTRSYLNWSSPLGPKSSHSIVFDLRIESVLFAKLLPGGRYFIAVDWDCCVYCYDTEGQNQIGSYIGASSRGEDIQDIDCLVLEEENALVLAYGALREDLQT